MQNFNGRYNGISRFALPINSHRLKSMNIYYRNFAQFTDASNYAAAPIERFHRVL